MFAIFCFRFMFFAFSTSKEKECYCEKTVGKSTINWNVYVQFFSLFCFPFSTWLQDTSNDWLFTHLCQTSILNRHLWSFCKHFYYAISSAVKIKSVIFLLKTHPFVSVSTRHAISIQVRFSRYLFWKFAFNSIKFFSQVWNFRWKIVRELHNRENFKLSPISDELMTEKVVVKSFENSIFA